MKKKLLVAIIAMLLGGCDVSDDKYKPHVNELPVVGRATVVGYLGDKLTPVVWYINPEIICVKNSCWDEKQAPKALQELTKVFDYNAN